MPSWRAEGELFLFTSTTNMRHEFRYDFSLPKHRITSRDEGNDRT